MCRIGKLTIGQFALLSFTAATPFLCLIIWYGLYLDPYWSVSIYCVAAAWMFSSFVMLGYWARENFRLGYGFVEVLLSFALLFSGLNEFLQARHAGMEFFAALAATVVLKVATAVYLGIRGLDNMGQDISAHIKAAPDQSGKLKWYNTNWQKFDKFWRFVSMKKID